MKSFLPRSISPGHTMNQAQSSLQQEQSYKQKRKQLFILFLIIFILIISAIISVFAALKHQLDSESLSSNPSEAIRAVCKLTPYYSVCVNSISPLHNPTQNIHPSDVFRLSIDAAYRRFLELASKIDNRNIRPALIHCQSLFDNSLSQLNESLIMIENGVGLDGEMWDYRVEGRMNDVRKLMLQAKENVERCLEMKNGKEGILEQAVMYMLNSLAILEKKELIHEMFDSSSFRSIVSSLVSKEIYLLIIVFGPQYLFLVFLVASLLRISV